MADKPPAPERWTLTFVAAPGHPATLEIRIRQLLKFAGRVLKLRSVPNPEPPASGQAKEGGRT